MGVLRGQEKRRTVERLNDREEMDGKKGGRREARVKRFGAVNETRIDFLCTRFTQWKGNPQANGWVILGRGLRLSCKKKKERKVKRFVGSGALWPFKKRGKAEVKVQNDHRTSGAICARAAFGFVFANDARRRGATRAKWFGPIS